MVRFLFLLLLFITNVSAQTLYCGQDTGLSSKVTLSNLARYSEQFDNAGYTKTALTVTANSIIAPDGTLTADTLVETTANSLHAIQQTLSPSPTLGDIYRFSVYAKAGTRRYIQIFSQNVGAGVYLFANFDLVSGTVTNTGLAATATIENKGNGWYKCTITATSLASLGSSPGVAIVTSATAGLLEAYAGAVTNNVHLWGYHVNLTSSPSDYIATAGSAATLASVCASGTTQSPTDPSKCIVMSDRGREIRTEAQIAIGSQ